MCAERKLFSNPVHQVSGPQITWSSPHFYKVTTVNSLCTRVHSPCCVHLSPSHQNFMFSTPLLCLLCDINTMSYQVNYLRWMAVSFYVQELMRTSVVTGLLKLQSNINLILVTCGPVYCHLSLLSHSTCASFQLSRSVYFYGNDRFGDRWQVFAG